MGLKSKLSPCQGLDGSTALLQNLLLKEIFGLLLTCLRHQGSFNMAQEDSTNETIATCQRRSHTKFTPDQLKLLIDTFNQKPYPGYATKQKLALEINTKESRIQIWLQNRSARCSFQGTETEQVFESNQAHRQDAPAGTQVGEARQCRTTYKSSQLCALIKAFKKNPYPGSDSRERLAKEIGVSEARVQIWLQN
ncbi:double homeobox protein A-like [Tamandua tetradactyla]|uniref:double homeobox protein A-like n=1 Tax=Tamandua tetradactyla TaxID=48850 RepID=UPI0040538137